MKTVAVILFALSLFASAHADTISRIAFGSCAHQNREQPIWEAVRESNPDVWVWLGDNIYGDTDDAKILAEKYALQKAKPGYSQLIEECRVLGTWDDHDFGKNNGGKEFSGKAITQKALLDFLDEPLDSPRRMQEGVYWSYLFGEGEQQVQVLLIDVRYHRDLPGEKNADIFGQAQRDWIVSQLSAHQPAVTLIASGTQVIPEDHRYEKWAQFPEARNWFFNTLSEHRESGVVFLSGDRHISEFSSTKLKGMEQPIFDITASSLSHSWEDFPGEENRHRVGKVFHQNNFGFLEIDWEHRQMLASIRDENGEAQRTLPIPF